MKTIYINLDDALRAVLTGVVPAQHQLPLAVTIPAGSSAAVFAQSGTATKTTDAGSNVARVTWSFSPSLGDAIASDVSLGLSQVLASESASVYAVSGDSFTATATIVDSNGNTYAVAFPVLVRRETASGPVDLIDFTTAATLSANEIREALAGAGTGALSGVSLDGTVDNNPDEEAIRGALEGAGIGALSGVDIYETKFNGCDIQTEEIDGTTVIVVSSSS